VSSKDDLHGRRPIRARVLDAYRATPGTCGAVRKPDRAFAMALFARAVPLEAVENALVLAASRRVVRRPDAPPLGVIRSLAYFGPVIDEVLESSAGPDYYRYLRQRLPHWLDVQRCSGQ
jgi:hypothetical protein